MNYFIGQRVLVDIYIGTIEAPPTKVAERNEPNTFKDVWVKLHGNTHPSYYSADNVRPLPNGQL